MENKIYTLAEYDEAYNFVTTHEGYTIKDLGNGTYEVVEIPPLPAPTKADIEQARASRYITEVDPMTAEINRLRDEEQTPKVLARIAELIMARKDAVAKIKEELPYPVDNEQKVSL